MEPERINSTELRTKTRDLMERVKYNGEIFLVETFGRPMAVIMSVEEYARVREALTASGLHLSQSALAPEPSANSFKRKPRRQRNSD